MWPPYGFKTVSPFGLPLLNTIILVSSGITLTHAQKAMAAHRPNEGGREEALYGMHLTLLFAVMFILVQWYEFRHCWFSINDSVYGSIFFFITGFHGIHVIIGTVFLFVVYLRILDYHFFREEQTAVDLAAWYWHFVDVVWIFVYLIVYCWGGK
jgi:heme/copper-type cytochrome/quinol oxidase subunit 3